MTDAQFAEIIRHLNRIETSQKKLARSFHNHDMKADGETEGNHPWLKLPVKRSAQVQKAYEYLVARKDEKGRKATIAEACRKTYEPKRGGYPSLSALEAYCYSVPITQFV